MPLPKPNSIGRDGVVMIDGDAEDIAAGRVVPKIAPDDLQKLTQTLGIQNPAHVAELEKVANCYYRDRAQRTKTPPTKMEQNASVEVMLKWVEKARRDQTDRSRGYLEALLLNADDELSWRLGNAFSKHFGGKTAPQVSEIPLEVIANALTECRTKSRGPLPPSRAEIGLIAGLTRLFETVSGGKATHNPKLKTAYVGEPQSAAGVFVLTAIKAIDPAILSTTINSLFGKFLKKPTRTDALRAK